MGPSYWTAATHGAMGFCVFFLWRGCDCLTKSHESRWFHPKPEVEMALTLRFDRERLVSAVPKIPVFIIFPSRICIFLVGYSPFETDPYTWIIPNRKDASPGGNGNCVKESQKKGSWKRWNWWYMTSWHSMKCYVIFIPIWSGNEMFVDQNEMYHKSVSVWGEMTCTFTRTAPFLIPVDPHVSSRLQPQAGQNLKKHVL